MLNLDNMVSNKNENKIRRGQVLQNVIIGHLEC